MSLLEKLAIEAVEFFTEQITEGKDIYGKPYKKRKFEFSHRKGRSILIQTGALRRSI